MINIKEEILKESMQLNPDWLYINILERINQGEISLYLFSKTGRMMSREKFLKTRPKARLHKNCIEVIVYVGKFYIQLLKTGRFIADMNDAEQEDEVSTMFENQELQKVEQALWENVAENRFKN